MMPALRTAVVLVAALMCGPVGAQPAYDARVAETTAERLLALAAANRSGELNSALQEVMTRPGWSDAQREAAIHAFVIGARSLPPERVPIEPLEALTEYRSKAMVEHPESRGDLMVPRFDIAGAAAGTLEHRAHRLAVASRLAELRANPGGFWSSLAAGKGAVDRRVLESVLESADAELLAASRLSLDKALGDAPGLMPGAIIVARRLADPGLARRVIRASDEATAGRMIRSLNSFDDGAALGLIQVATERPALASSAVFEAGRLAGRLPAARRWLLGRLDDPALGSSAAAALARLERPSLDRRMIRELESRPAGAGMRHRLLYLHLRDVPAARGALAAFVRDPEAPADLRAEVRGWL